MNKFNVSAFQTANINEKMQAPLIKDDVMQGRKKMIKVRGARRCAPMVQAASNFF